MQSTINKRIIPQQNMTFDYSTPDLKIIAKEISPSARIDLSSDIEYLNQLQESIRRSQQYRAQTFEAVHNIGNTIQNFTAQLENKMKQADQQTLSAIAPYAIAFRDEDYKKLKTKEGKKLYLQLVASKYLESLDADLQMEFQQEWKDIKDPKEFNKAVEEFLSSKIQEASKTLPEEIRDDWLSQATLVKEYLKNQLHAFKLKTDIQQLKQEEMLSDENTVSMATTDILANLTDEITNFQNYITDVSSQLSVGGSVNNLEKDFTKQTEQLHAAVSAALDAYFEKRDIPKELRPTIENAVTQYIDNLIVKSHQAILNQYTNASIMRKQMQTQDYLNKTFYRSFEHSNIPVLLKQAETYKQMLWSGDLKPEEYQERIKAITQTLHTQYQSIIEDLKHDAILNKLPSSELRKMAAAEFIKRVGEVAVNSGIPELLDVAKIKDMSGIAIEANSDLQETIQKYKEQAEDMASKMQEEQEKMLEEFQKTQIEQQKENLATAVFNMKHFFSPEFINVAINNPGSQQEKELKDFLNTLKIDYANFVAKYMENPTITLQTFKKLYQQQLQSFIINSSIDPSSKAQLLNWLDKYTTESITFAKTSDAHLYTYFYDKAWKGELDLNELIEDASYLSETDYNKILQTYIQVRHNSIDERIKKAKEYADFFIKTYCTPLKKMASQIGVTNQAENTENTLKLLEYQYIEELQQSIAEGKDFKYGYGIDGFIQYIKDKAPQIDLSAPFKTAVQPLAEYELQTIPPEAQKHVIVPEQLTNEIPEEIPSETGLKKFLETNKEKASLLSPLYQFFDEVAHNKALETVIKAGNTVAKMAASAQKYLRSEKEWAKQSPEITVNKKITDFLTNLKTLEVEMNTLADTYKEGLPPDEDPIEEGINSWFDEHLSPIFTVDSDYDVKIIQNIYQKYKEPIEELKHKLSIAVKEKALFKKLDEIIQDNPIYYTNYNQLVNLISLNIEKYGLPQDYSRYYAALYLKIKAPTWDILYQNYSISLAPTQ